MSKQIELSLTPREAFDEIIFQEVITDRLHLSPGGDQVFHPLKRSIDARSRNIVVRIVGEIISKEEKKKSFRYTGNYPDVLKARRVAIVGAGPAGLFAALKLMEAGFKPVVIERGSDVQARRRDLAAINKDHIVN